MDDRIFQDENHKYQFDFSKANWASDSLNSIFHQSRISILSDVDFIAETQDKLILVEYKNANVAGAANPDAFKPDTQKLINKIAYKFYDSWIYLKSIKKDKPIHYVYILEYPSGDSVTRGMLRNKITDVLPFRFQQIPDNKVKMIEAFSVLSIDEWNHHEEFSQFPITPVDENH